MRLVNYVVSVSKRHKNNHAGVKNGAWVVYYYDEDWKMQTKRINPLLIWYYKLKRYHRKHAVCPGCDRRYLVLTNWHDKNIECPYCLDEYDEF